jgi:hypothetical protein
VGDTAALVLDLGCVVQLQEDVVDWFVALAVGGFDAGSVDVLYVAVDALATVAAGVS